MASVSRYCRILPLQSKGADNPYQPSSQLDFLLNLEQDREILYNSFQLGFQMLVNGAPLGANAKIYLNQYAGYHSIIDSIQTLVDDGQGEKEVETILAYPRFVASQNYVNNTDVNVQYDLSKNSSGLVANNIMAQRELLGSFFPPETAALGYKNGSVACDLKLNFCLNKSYDAHMMPSNIGGKKNIRIIIRLNPASRVFWGDDVTNTTTYSLNNVILQWVEQPKSHSENVMLQTVQQVKVPVPSSTASLSVKTPSALTTKWMMTFSANADENAVSADYYRLSVLPGIKRIELYTNDQYQNTQYPLNNGYYAAPEIMATSLMSLGANPENASNWFRYFYDVSGSTVGSGRGLILGSSFPAFAAAETRITANIVSGIDSTISTWFAYTYLFSLSKV